MSMSGLFENRESFLVFGDYLPSVTQQWVHAEKDADSMCSGPDSDVSNCVRLQNIGWQLKSYHQAPGEAIWLTAAQPGLLSAGSGNAILADGYQENPVFTQQTSTGLDYNAGVQSQGAPFAQLQAASDGDLSTYVLSADQAAYPSPFPGEDTTNMDRVYLGTSGAVEPWDNLVIGVYVPGGSLTPNNTVATIMFNGPAGSDPSAQTDSSLMGTGQYGLKFRSDGRAYLYEKLASGDWTSRYSFQYLYAQNATQDTLVWVTISNRMFQDAAGNYQGDRIMFADAMCYDDPRSFGVLNSVTQLAEFAISGAVKRPAYMVPRVTQQPCSVVPVRVDVARGCRASFQVMKHVYYTPGYIQDDFIALEQPWTPDGDFAIAVPCVIPVGTSISLEVFDENGASLSSTSALSITNTPKGQQAYQTFTPSAQQRYVQVKITLNASGDGFRSPIIISYAIDRQRIGFYSASYPSFQVPARSNLLPALWQSVISSIQIDPQTTDPGSENATFVVNDYTGGLEALRDTNMLPVALCTTYDEEGDYSVLFRGYILNCGRRERRSDGSKAYPAQGWSEYTLSCVGEWARTAEAIIPRMQPWNDTELGTALRVSDIVFKLAQMTYPDEMIDVASLPIQLFTTDGEAYVAQEGSKSIDLMREFAEDYLGAYMVYDACAGSTGAGMLRMLQQKIPPYNNLAIFEFDHPTALAGDFIPRLPQVTSAYGITTASNGQVMQHAFVKAGTFFDHRDKAEGNCVTVFGGGVAENASDAGSSSGALFCQTAIKVDSFNFLDLAPSSPGYPDGSSPEFYGRIVPIKNVDHKLQTQGQVDWKCRRIFERACYSKYICTFDAPMLLIEDITDPSQSQPRRLRFYDPVLLRQPDGSLGQMLVESCVPTYQKDRIQWAHYTLISQSNIDTIGVMRKIPGGIGDLAKTLSRMFGRDLFNGSVPWAANSLGGPAATKILQLPSPTSNPIQDLDPTSATFGDFYPMLDYDLLP